MTIHLYGIPNCDTVKKARRWLDERGHVHVFHDYKKEGVDPARLSGWANSAGWPQLLNTRGTTFRQLPESDRAGLTEDRALALMVAYPSLIKRPVVEYAGEPEPGLLIGFDPARWAQALS